MLVAVGKPEFCNSFSELYNKAYRLCVSFVERRSIRRFCMKKASLLILIVLYAVSSFGIGIRAFYCCGKLKSIQFSFVQEAKDKTANGENKKGDCCKTTHHFFKVKDNHKAADNVYAIAKPVIQLHEPGSIFNAPLYFTGQVAVSYHSHAPPIPAGVPLYVSNRVFLI
jgi:hypothetical protein